VASTTGWNLCVINDANGLQGLNHRKWPISGPWLKTQAWTPDRRIDGHDIKAINAAFARDTRGPRAIIALPRRVAEVSWKTSWSGTISR
jgi:hypothetical protein